MLATCASIFVVDFRKYLVVGLWNAQGDLSKAKERIGADATTHVVATLADAQEQIRMLVERRAKQVQPDAGKLVVAGACK